MLSWFLAAAAGLATLGFMEFYAYFMHRYVMHGFLWCWHKSHHEPRTGRFERNDLFAVVFSLPAIACIGVGAHAGSLTLIAIGLGITGYGAVYAVFHDGLVHQRFQTPINRHSAFWQPRVAAHYLHHAMHTKKNCISFGFMVVEPVEVLHQKLLLAKQTQAEDVVSDEANQVVTSRMRALQQGCS
jgi:beta-carotene 3-hydroxylase